MRSKKQIARGEQELTSIKKGKNSEQQSVRRLSRQIASRRQLLDETESQLSLLAEQLAASDSTAGALNVRLERYRAQYAAMVREAYRNYKQNSYLTYIFASKDFADVARRIANIRGVAKLREAKLREIARDGAGGGTAAGTARRAAAGARLHTPQDRRPTGPLRTRPAQRQGTTATHVGARKGRTARKGAAGGAARHGHRRIAETHQGQQGGSPRSPRARRT